MMRLLVGVVIVLALAGASIAQEPEKPGSPSVPPALTDVQKLQVANLAQRLELTQMQIRAAQLDYERTVQQLQQLVLSLQVPDYELNLQTLQYTKKPAPPKASGTPPK